MSNSFDNTTDVIDSRSVIARIEELEEERDAAQEESESALVSWLDDSGEELRALIALANEASFYANDWESGVQLIRDSYFKDYAQELADDIGIDLNQAWPLSCIDWDQAAYELRMDYTSVDFDGVMYWVR